MPITCERERLKFPGPWMFGGSGVPAFTVLVSALGFASAGSAAQVEEWRVEVEPTVQMGALGAATDLNLYGVSGAVLLGDGRVAVADGAQRILLFSQEGALLRTIGRAGDGPGEFRRISRLSRAAGDTLVAWDIGNYRLSFLTAEAGFVRSVPTTVMPPAMFQGAFSDGTYLATRGVPGGGGPTGGVQIGRGQLELVRLDGNGDFINRVAVVSGPESLDLGGAGPRVMFRSGELKRTIVATFGNRAFVATGDRFEVLVFSSDGGDPESIRADYSPIPYTEEDLMEHLSDGPYESIVTARTVQNWPSDHTRAATIGLLVDDDGNVWVEEYRESPDEEGDWRVFRSDGTQVASVKLPSRFRALQIGTEEILGVSRDELDVETVEIRRIVR